LRGPEVKRNGRGVSPNKSLHRRGECQALLAGILIQVAGLCFLTNSFAPFLSPALADRLFPVILLPVLVGELSLWLWLPAKGVDAARWQEVNARAAEVQ